MYLSQVTNYICKNASVIINQHLVLDLLGLGCIHKSQVLALHNVITQKKIIIQTHLLQTWVYTHWHQ